MEWRQAQDRIVIGLGVAGVLTIFLGNLLGWWWLASLVGLSLGLLAPNWRGVVAAVAAGGGGWALGLLWDALHHAIAPTAQALSLTMGIGSDAIISILVTILLGALLAGSAAWLGRALRTVTRPRTRQYS